jgi:hypothetical protein
MTTAADYGAVRFVLMNLAASFDPKAPAVPPSSWERFQTRLRNLF